jgi:hypothetical protein
MAGQASPMSSMPHCPAHSDIDASPLPDWLSGRCCRCLLPGHRAATCRDPIRCSRCLRSGHRSRECVNAWQPMSSLSGLVVLSQPCHDAHPCCGKMLVDERSPLQRPATSPPLADVQSILVEQAMLLRSELQGCLDGLRVSCWEQRLLLGGPWLHPKSLLRLS